MGDEYDENDFDEDFGGDEPDDLDDVAGKPMYICYMYPPKDLNSSKILTY